MKAVSAVEILKDLVAIPSVSSVSNCPIIDYIARHLDPGAWNISMLPYRDSAGLEKVNFVAVTKGTASAQPELALVCHTDTVPFEPDWKEAFNPAVRDDRLYGRGSCDVKGFLSCILAAVSSTDITRLKRPLALVFTADEEIGCVGARLIAKENAIRSRYMVIGEPTGLTPVHAGKGYALGEIVVHGKPAHSAFPQHGHSAIRDAARVIERLDEVATRLAAETDTGFDPPFTTLNVGLIRGGSAKNIVPAECRITVEWRPIPGQDPRWAATLIEEQLASLRNEFLDFHARLDIQRLDPAFRSSGSDLSSMLESMTGRTATTVAFGTEAAHLAPLASEVVVFGPGDMTTAHKSGEFVPIPELAHCQAYLTMLIEQLCRAPKGT